MPIHPIFSSGDVNPESNGRLTGRVCLITGAASGIGRATALLFRAEGARVAGADLDAAGEVELALTGDVANEDDVGRIVDEVVRRFGRVDVLVNNAGISGVGDLVETTPEQWDRVMRVNARSVFLMCRAVVPGMCERGSGVVVNVASAIAETGLARRVSYAASKGAVLALTKSLQVDCAPYGVRVNAVLPGTIHTPFVDAYLREAYADPAEGLRAIKARQLTGELGSPEDVARAILFLASDESRFVLGSGLAVDGGLSGTRA
jgi:NAD(P)-dependent dehydrogenase (short-subunit alcohol dehydrogenase family)